MKQILSEIRSQFPILSRQVNGKPLVYFDNAATTQRPNAVIEAEATYYRELNANVHRGVHYLSTQSTIAFEDARKSVAQFINASSDSEIIYTRGTTESINLVASSFTTLMKPGDNIIITAMEHHSNIVPWQLACQRQGLELRVAKLTTDEILDVDHLKSLADENTKLISVAHISNVLGVINPIKEIIDFAHSEYIPVLIDAAQSVAHLTIDVQSLDCDFLVFSGHKMYGPMGTGVLYGKEKWLDKMPPYQSGGEMIKNVSFEGTTFNELPYKFEAGTPNVAGALGLHAAIDFLKNIGLKNAGEYEHELTEYAMRKFRETGNIRIFAPDAERSAVISFLINGVHPYDSGTLLDKLGIAIRTGTHCAEPLMKHFGITGTMRISFALYNTKEEIDYFFESLNKIKSIFE
jgi:cysteine desulfurase/selenocysteine lyase